MIPAMSQEQDERDFADILAEFESGGESSVRDKDPKPGERVSGKILSIGEESIFVDVGAKSDAIVHRSEVENDDGEVTVVMGDTLKGMISGHDAASGCLILRVKAGAGPGLGGAGTELALEEIAQAQANGFPVEGTVSEVVKGGVRVMVSGLRAFCPISQLELGYIEDASSYVGRRLPFKVRNFSPSGRGRHPDIVLSRRALLEAEEKQRREEALAQLREGTVVRGIVSSVTSYGAFVNLGGIEGLLHVSEMSHDRVSDPAELVQEGDEVEVKILSVIEAEAKEEGKGRRRDRGPRISLSRKALEQDPWNEASRRFPLGTVVSGRVVRVEVYGAFIRLAPGLDGLAHISELGADRRISHAREVVDLGQDLKVKILAVDPDRRRISVSVAAIEKDTQAGFAAEYAQRQEKSSSGFGAMAGFFEKAKKS